MPVSPCITGSYPRWNSRAGTAAAIPDSRVTSSSLPGPACGKRRVGRLALLLAVLAGPASADCDHFTPQGRPFHRASDNASGTDGAPDWVILCHAGQVVAFNPARNVPDWVAYRLRREDLISPRTERREAYRPDPGVPLQHRVAEDDYRKTGYDRGHLAPAGSMKWSEAAMSESFYMSNMAPQVGAGFNRGIWRVLERKMRQWGCERGLLHVVTGPLYEDRETARLAVDMDGDGVDDNGILVDVPSHFFKLALDPGRMEAIAFILPNRKLKADSLPGFLASIDEIEARSRLDFLPNLRDEVEHDIERRVEPGLWDRPVAAACQALH